MSVSRSAAGRSEIIDNMYFPSSGTQIKRVPQIEPINVKLGGYRRAGLLRARAKKVLDYPCRAYEEGCVCSSNQRDQNSKAVRIRPQGIFFFLRVGLGRGECVRELRVLPLWWHCFFW